ncbi:MAG: lycopene cyclase domain-containing protein [Candidatus Saccharimonadaceae bacterium]
MGIVTYAVLNLAFLAVALFFVRDWLKRSRRHFVSITLHLLVLTAVFDSLIVYAGIVGYDPTKTLGVSIGFAPIEDFAYTIAAALLLPTLWHYFGKEEVEK